MFERVCLIVDHCTEASSAHNRCRVVNDIDDACGVWQ